MLSRSMRKEDHAAVNATGTAAICNLCDLYTSNKLDGKWTELAEVYDQRRNMDNYREILDLKAPTARMNELNGWHLERMAVGEFESRSDTIGDDLAEIKRKSRMIKQTLNKILANGRVFKIKRDELEAAMTRQRETLTAELWRGTIQQSKRPFMMNLKEAQLIKNEQAWQKTKTWVFYDVYTSKQRFDSSVATLTSLVACPAQLCT